MEPVFAIFGVGSTELIVIGIVVVLLFGNRVPEVMRGLGRGIKEFKEGVNSIEDDVRAK